MVESESDLMTLLRQLHDPAWLEWPMAYYRSEAAVPFGRLVASLDSDFGTSCSG